MEGLPPPAPEERQRILVAENGMTTLVVEGTALCTADDPTLVSVWGTHDALSIIGKKRGRTVLHVARPEKPKVDVDVEVAAPLPNALALGVGDTVLIPAEGIKEWSESGPGFVELSAEGSQIVVKGRKAGTNVVVFVLVSGESRSLEITVVGGDRQL